MKLWYKMTRVLGEKYLFHQMITQLYICHRVSIYSLSRISYSAQTNLTVSGLFLLSLFNKQSFPDDDFVLVISVFSP